jgi:hypothetical protein
MQFSFTSQNPPLVFILWLALRISANLHNRVFSNMQSRQELWSALVSRWKAVEKNELKPATSYGKAGFSAFFFLGKNLVKAYLSFSQTLYEE